MKKCLCGDDLAGVYKHGKTVLLIKLLDVILDLKAKGNTGQIEVGYAVFLYDYLF